LDLSFSPPAFTGTNFPQPEVKALALQADGRILVGGILRADQWREVRSLVRLNPDGSLDDQPTSVTVSWRSEPGASYYVDFKPTLATADWTPVSGGIIAQGTQASWTGLRPPSSSAFYRVVRLGD
jgi:beta-propeller uncharacterized protein DUF5122